MGVKFTIFYHRLVIEKDIPLLNSAWQIKIKRAIESKLATAPEVFGKPLRKSLKGYRKLRVGDWRVIFSIEKHVVKVFIIAHRSRVYENVLQRK